MTSSGSANLGNWNPKSFMGYFEKIEPTIPETGMIIMHIYKKNDSHEKLISSNL